MAYEDLDDYSVGAAGSDTFDIVIPDLDPSSAYPIQFRWQFADKTAGLWSVSKVLYTPEIARPESTNITAVWNGTNLEISWEAPNLANGFTIYLTSGATTVPFGYTLDKTKTTQKFIISSRDLINNFASVLPTTLTGLLKTTYIDTSTVGTAFAIPPYADAISGQNILDTDWSVLSVSNGFTVSWGGTLVSSAEYKYTEVHTSSSQAGTYDIVYSGVGPAIVTVASLSTNYIKIKHVSVTGLKSSFSSVKEAVPFDPIVFDSTPPVNTFTLGTTTVTDDSNGLFSFDKKVLFTWTENTDSSTSGYRIRFRIAGSGSVYTYMSVPGKEKTSTYIYGLKGGKSYEVAVSTFDIYGNTNETQWQTYPNIVVAVSNSLLADVAITAGDMKLGYGISSDNSKKGLYIAPDNYWYVQGNTNLSSAAYLSVGGATDKLVWNGTNLSVTGTINANAGNFTGAIQVGNASTYGQFKLQTPAGTKIEMGAFTNAAGSYTGGVGIQGTDATGTLFQLDTSSGIIVNKGSIGGWTITSNAISKSNTSLGSDGSITAGSAGQFSVSAAGALSATGANISGTINAVSGFIGSTNGTSATGFSFNSTQITSVGAPVGSSQIILDGSTGTISGGKINGTLITGADITISGSASAYGTSTTKLLFSASNYKISAGSSTSTYTNTTGYFDIDGEWVSAGGTTSITNNDIRFTDNTWGGAVPYGSTFSYGELWLGSGTNQTGTVDLWANYPGDYIGISLTADATTQNIIIKGPASAGFQTAHISSATPGSTSESPAFLQVDSSGRLTRGRAIFSGGSSSPSSNIGLQGDLYFSTAS
jgi:hypothetical protein